MADSLCSRRFLLQQGLPDEPSEYAESGNRIHAALAKYGLPDQPPALEALTLDERDVYDRCMSVEAKVIHQFFNGKVDGLKAFREQRFWAKFDANGSSYLHSGKPDVVYKQGLRALVIEYKTARGDVPESPRNLQLRDQAVLIHGNMVPTNEIGTVVIQPLVTMSPTISVYSQMDLARATKEMFDRVVRSHDPKAKAVPGEIQCQYCKAKRLCSEYGQWAGQITPPAMLTVLKIPMQEWTPEQRATAAGALGPAQKFLDGLKDFLKEQLERDPASVPGWMLQPGSVRESIKDPQKVFERFSALGGTVEQFMGCVKVTKTELKKSVNVVTGAKGKALDQALETITKDCTEQTTTAPTLRRVDPEPQAQQVAGSQVPSLAGP